MTTPTIYLGDSREILKTIDDNSVDLIFISFVAKRMLRKAIGIEILLEYYDYEEAV
jgi:DNA modification methylase